MIKIKSQQSFVIDLNGRESIFVTKLGKGRFTTVYTDGNFVYAFVKNCQMKEAISLFGDSNNPHVPKIEMLDEGPNGTYVYKMPIYHKLTSKHKVAWNQYRELKKIWDEAIIACHNLVFSWQFL